MEFTLRPATPDEVLARDRLTHEAWGARLSPEQFVAREAALRAHRWSRRSMTTWLLVDSNQRVLSSCETFAMDSRTPDGDWSVSLGVASVFTEQALRGRGYALAMMTALTDEVRARWPEAHALHLYSDVGEALYARAGYVAAPAFDEIRSVSVDASSLPPPSLEETRSRAESGDVRRIDRDELTEAWAGARPPAEGFVIWPSADQLDWHLERERIYAKELKRRSPSRCGARCGEAVGVWVADFRDDVLRVLALTAGSSSAERESVLGAAAEAAAECGYSEVRQWVDAAELPLASRAATGEARPGSAVRVQRRTSSLPMLRPLGGTQPTSWRAIQRGIWV